MEEAMYVGAECIWEIFVSFSQILPKNSLEQKGDKDLGL